MFFRGRITTYAMTKNSEWNRQQRSEGNSRVAVINGIMTCSAGRILTVADTSHMRAH